MLAWWQQWVQYRHSHQELLESSCCHMEAYTMHRCAFPGLGYPAYQSCGWLAKHTKFANFGNLSQGMAPEAMKTSCAVAVP